MFPTSSVIARSCTCVTAVPQKVVSVRSYVPALILLCCSIFRAFKHQNLKFTHCHLFKTLDYYLRCYLQYRWTALYIYHFSIFSKGKGKAVPLQSWSGPEVSRKLSFPYFMTIAQDGGKVVSLTHRLPLPPGNVTGTRFC